MLRRETEATTDDLHPVCGPNRGKLPKRIRCNDVLELPMGNLEIAGARLGHQQAAKRVAKNLQRRSGTSAALCMTPAHATS